MFNRFIYRREWSFRIYRETLFAFFVRRFTARAASGEPRRRAAGRFRV
ncbi:hypothetical protein ABLN67_01860 [Mycobacterium tuberculosis]